METFNAQNQLNFQQDLMESNSLEEVLGCPKTQQQEIRRLKPQPEQALKCPRCESTNTKFCYYNNYSLSQPRYFCKGCRRYWTKGGSLRNVPVGGGCRKNKRSSSSSKKSQDQAQTQALITTNSNSLLPTLTPPSFGYDPNDLTLAFARLHKQPTTRQFGMDDHDTTFLLGNTNPNPNHMITTTPTGPGFLDILRSGFLETNTPSGFNNLYYGFGGINGNMEEVEGGGVGEEVVLPYEEGVGGATATNATQGCCKVVDGGENKVMMGMQWQVGGDGNLGVDSSARDYWNGVGSTWHGLINSSLM